MARRPLHAVLRGALFAASCAGALACHDEFPSNAYRFDPPPQYALWWHEAEACSGTSGDISRVRWYRTPPGVAIQGAPGIAGQYDPTGHRIVLAGDFVDNGGVVRHEILHALHPRVAHPRDLFRRRCGDVVPCSGPCAIEAGAPPSIPTNVRRVLPRELDVSIQATPANPRADVFGGHFVLVVIARNPYAEPVMVNFPDSTQIGGTRTFGFRLGEYPIGSLSFYHGFPYDRSAGYFLAHESKRAVYDFRMQDDGSGFPRPGPHYAFGVFNEKATDTLRFTIGTPD